MFCCQISRAQTNFKPTHLTLQNMMARIFDPYYLHDDSLTVCGGASNLALRTIQVCEGGEI